MNCSSKIKRIESFIGSHESGRLTSEKLDELKGLKKALREQFGHMEVGWEIDRRDIKEEVVFKELEKIVADTEGLQAIHQGEISPNLRYWRVSSRYCFHIHSKGSEAAGILD